MEYIKKKCRWLSICIRDCFLYILVSSILLLSAHKFLYSNHKDSQNYAINSDYLCWFILVIISYIFCVKLFKGKHFNKLYLCVVIIIFLLWLYIYANKLILSILVILMLVFWILNTFSKQSDEEKQSDEVYKIIDSINKEIKKGDLSKVESKAYYIYSLFNKIDETNKSSLYTDDIRNAVGELKENIGSENSAFFKSMEDLTLIETYVDKVIASEKKSSWLDCISIDYLITKKAKGTCREEGKDVGELIERFNQTNLILSLGLVLTFALLLLIAENSLPLDNNLYILMLYFFIVIRTMSRGSEIIIAFLKDIFEVKKETTLTPGDRVKLALRSLIEITILFTALYIPYNFSSNMSMMFLDSFIFSFGISTLTDVNLTFEVIEKGQETVLSTFLPMKSLIIVFHVTIALTLIVLSLAQYVGNIGSEKKS